MERAVLAPADEPSAGWRACNATLYRFRAAAMTVFSCARCGCRLTPNLRPIAPRRATGFTVHHRGILRVLPGWFAVDPEPFGPSDIGPAATRGTILVHSRDLRGVAPHPDPLRRSGCCRPSGTQGPNLVCAVCGLEVATEQADCWTVPSVHLEPGAVTVRGGRAVPVLVKSGYPGLRQVGSRKNRGRDTGSRRVAAVGRQRWVE